VGDIVGATGRQNGGRDPRSAAMSNATQLIERYIRTWNETDAGRRRALINEIWTEDAHYVDPLAVAEGRDAIDATIAGAQEMFPDLTFRLAGGVDAHHNLRSTRRFL
jgi:SnoaL-like domain